MKAVEHRPKTEKILKLFTVAIGPSLATNLSHLFFVSEKVPRNFFVDFALGPKKDISPSSEWFISYLLVASIFVLWLSLGQKRAHVVPCILLSHFLFITVPGLTAWFMIELLKTSFLSNKEMVAASFVCIWIFYTGVLSISLLATLVARRRN